MSNRARKAAKSAHKNRASRRKGLADSVSNAQEFLSDQKKKQLQSIHDLQQAQRVSKVASGLGALAGGLAGFHGVGGKGGKNSAMVGAAIGSLFGQQIGNNSNKSLSDIEREAEGLTSESYSSIQSGIDALRDSNMADTVNYATTAYSFADGVEKKRLANHIKKNNLDASLVDQGMAEIRNGKLVFDDDAYSQAKYDRAVKHQYLGSNNPYKDDIQESLSGIFDNNVDVSYSHENITSQGSVEAPNELIAMPSGNSVGAIQYENDNTPSSVNREQLASSTVEQGREVSVIGSPEELMNSIFGGETTATYRPTDNFNSPYRRSTRGNLNGQWEQFIQRRF